MLFHAAIPAHDPRRVAAVLAEILDGHVVPFPAAPGSFVAIANEWPGAHVEVHPASHRRAPSPDRTSSVRLGGLDPVVGTHLALGVPCRELELHRIARREGWRSRTAQREGAFRVVELWLENWFMLEALPPEMQAEYRDFVTSGPRLGSTRGGSGRPSTVLTSMP